MDQKKPKQTELLRVRAEGYLDSAMEFSLDLSADDSVYGLVYIGEKLAKCTSYLERLGDISINLSKISLEVTRQVSEHRSLVNVKERQFRDDPNYKNGDRATKGSWLTGKLEVYRIELEDWELTLSYLREIREAVNDRIQLFKRLDSDIRLHHKLVEAKIGVGATGSGLGGEGNGGDPGFPSSPSGGIDELEID